MDVLARVGVLCGHGVGSHRVGRREVRRALDGTLRRRRHLPQGLDDRGRFTGRRSLDGLSPEPELAVESTGGGTRTHTSFDKAC
ncbi:hypothetical protein PLANTIT3_61313 [Plantibacter sp. T3]|nr:hypothetical protein PLANTIT3_61313 [Plantibacter sp. T3]